MQKVFWITGSMLALVFLMQVNSGNVNTTDVLSVVQNPDEGSVVDVIMMEKKVAVQGEARQYFEVADDAAYAVKGSRIPFEKRIEGVLMSADLGRAQQLASFFSRLAQTQEVDSFVILAKNHSRLGAGTIASIDFGFDTPFGKLEPDFELLGALGLESSYRAFKNEAGVTNLLPYIKKYFPEARVVPVVMKDFGGDDEVRELMRKLADEDAVAIFSTEFAKALDGHTNSFHNEMTRTVLESGDDGDLSQLDVESEQVVLAATSFMNKKGLKVMDTGAELVFEKGVPVEERDLTIMAFGDMMLGRFVRTLMNQNGLDYIFERIKGPEGLFFEGADVVFGNLEGPIKGSGKSGGTAMNFAFNEDVAPLLRDNGFNLLSLANNHALDQGWDGYGTTIEALDGVGVGWCGHPSEPSADAVYYGEVGGKRYAFLCFQDVTHKLNDAAAQELIRQVRPTVDFVIVSVHWGPEYNHRPDFGLEVDPGRGFVDAGADFVIGHHPHVVQSFEVYKDRLIFYSLGNFVFDQYWSGETQEELAIGIVLDDDGGEMKTKVYLFPMKSARSQSYLLEGEERARLLEEFTSYAEYDEKTKEMIRNGVVEVSGR